MNKSLLAISMFIVLLIAASGCTTPAPEETTTTTSTVEEINQTQAQTAVPGETMEISLIDDSELAELEAELEALENELNSILEIDELDMTDV